MKYSQDFYDGKYTVNIYTNFDVITNIEIVYNNDKADERVFDWSYGEERSVVYQSHN